LRKGSTLNGRTYSQKREKGGGGTFRVGAGIAMLTERSSLDRGTGFKKERPKRGGGNHP